MQVPRKRPPGWPSFEEEELAYRAALKAKWDAAIVVHDSDSE